MKVIDVQGLSKSFGDKKVVDNVDLAVESGEIVGFLGPNGSGKTTTIRLICGLLNADSGSGSVLGFDVRKQSRKIKAETGYMTQKFSFYEDLTIGENLDFVARLYRLPQRKQQVEQSLERLGLVNRRNQLAGTLSGGWKQRLALAACIMHKPKLLLLDEPTAGVDPKARREFWDEIHKLAHEGLTVLVSTHYMDEAERCHRIVYISYGQVIARGTVDEVIGQSGLTTWIVEGRDLTKLALDLRRRTGIEQVTSFGMALHIVGGDAEKLKQAIAPFRAQEGLRWQSGETTLEDVFIQLMDKRQDPLRG